MWKEAEDIARRALTIDPHEATGMRMLLLSSLNRTGNAQEPLRLLATFPPDDLLLPNTGMFDMVIGTRGETFVLGRDFNAALKACETGTVATTNERQRFAAKAAIRVLAGDVPGAQAEAEKAREPLETRLREHPNDIRSQRALSWVYLALGRKTDAINIARQALELLPPEKDAVLGSGNLASLGPDAGADRSCHGSGAESEKTSFDPGGRDNLHRAAKDRSGLGSDPQRPRLPTTAHDEGAHRANDERSDKFLRRAEAAQCLQGSGRICGRGLALIQVTPGIPILRNPELGR